MTAREPDKSFPAPTGLRRDRASAAFHAFSSGMYGPDRAMRLVSRPEWEQGIWAEIADTIFKHDATKTPLDPATNRKACATAAFQRRAALAGQTPTMFYDWEPALWGEIVDAVLSTKGVS